MANFALGLRHMFTPSASPPEGVRIAFRFPDGELVASVADGKLTAEAGPADGLPVDATVTCHAPGHIAILHRDARPGPDTGGLDTDPLDIEGLDIEGAAAAFQRLRACLT